MSVIMDLNRRNTDCQITRTVIKIDIFNTRIAPRFAFPRLLF